MPQALTDKPDLFDDLVDIWNMFWRLNGSRQITHAGMGPIPVSEILALMQLMHIDPEDWIETLDLLMQADDIYLGLKSGKGGNDGGNSESGN